MHSGRIAVALFVLAAVQGNAQTREFEARFDSLERVAQRTRAAITTYDDSVKRAARMLDTAYRGNPTVLADVVALDRIRMIAPRVVDSLASVIGAAQSNLAGYALVARIRRATSWRGARDTSSEFLMTIIQPDGAELRGWRGPTDSVTIATTFAQAMLFTAFTASGAAFFAWANATLPGGALSEAEWANQRLLLVSAGSAVGSRCFEGDIGACKQALMITRPTDPIMEWHDTVTRRQLVRRHGALARRIDAATTRQCEAGSDASCIRLLRQFPANRFREPVAGGLRSAFLRHALAIGGNGAVERLLTASPEPAARLAAAAMVPLDTLLSAWQRRVRNTRAPSEDLSVGITLMALAWATGLGALSLRSSRWR